MSTPSVLDQSEKKCPIIDTIENALNELAREEKNASVKLKATFVIAKLRAFSGLNYKLAALILEQILEEPQTKCSECGREK